MCSINAHEKMHPTGSGDTSSGGVRPLPYYSTVDMLVSIVITLNFIVSWVQSFKTNYLLRKRLYGEKMREFFNNIPVTIPQPKPDDYKNKIKHYWNI